MIIKCLYNTKEEIKDFPIYQKLKDAGYGSNLNKYLIEKNHFYVVYGIKNDKYDTLFAIADESFFCYPMFWEETFFEITDSRPSRYWHPKYREMTLQEMNNLQEGVEISFSEWTEDPNFYYKLVEGEAVPSCFSEKEAKEAIKIFQRYKALMDLEFALPTVINHAVSLDHHLWVLCPGCDETWEDPNASIHEMVQCPKCKTLYLSPFVKNVFK